ncbi:MAG: helix-hairpin-helix domain-containing protein [Clostridia bacterium]|jgi:competence protein ComEA
MKKNLPVIIIAVCFMLLMVFLIVKNISKGLVPIPDDCDFITDIPAEMIKICLKGEVVNPGIYEIEKGSILNELLDKAGGLTKDAGEDINMVLVLDKNMTIYIRSVNEAGGVDISDNQDAIIQKDDEKILFENKININTASTETLCILPGIGEKTAQAIVAYRMENGDFVRIEDIMNVPGIKNAKFETIKDYITIGNKD